jgi:sec-independent protein translocase protein TatA
MAPLHSPLAFLDILSGSEMSVILLAVLIFFGGEKMPEFARGLGKAMREFRRAASDVEQEIKRAMDDLEHAPPVRPIRPPTATLPHSSDLGEAPADLDITAEVVPDPKPAAPFEHPAAPRPDEPVSGTD